MLPQLTRAMPSKTPQPAAASVESAEQSDGPATRVTALLKDWYASSGSQCAGDDAKQRLVKITEELVEIAISSGSLRFILIALQVLFQLASKFPEVSLDVSPFLKRLETFENELDASLPFAGALRGVFLLFVQSACRCCGGIRQQNLVY